MTTRARRLILSVFGWLALAILPGAAAQNTATVVDRYHHVHATRANSVKQTVLHRFQGGSDGATIKFAGLVADSTGALYGTTEAGGTACAGSVGCGTIFKLTPSGTGYNESVIHDFRDGRDGAGPFGGLSPDGNGDYFGTTAGGGGDHKCFGGCGTVFKLTPSGTTYTESVIYTFHGKDGASPFAGVIVDQHGNVYGTTELGGNYSSCPGQGCGTVFKLTPSESGYSESILWSFSYNGRDGFEPYSPLLLDASGALYGTTTLGGSGRCDSGCGTVFKLTPQAGGYKRSTIYSFAGGVDGGEPYAGVIEDANGALYGTTSVGNDLSHGCGVCGTVFKLTPVNGRYIESVLHAFSGGVDGAMPEGGLLAGKSGALYGTTSAGGLGTGTIFELIPKGKLYKNMVLYDFQAGSDGSYPASSLIADASGRLFGTTMYGGGSSNCDGGCGTAFEIKP